MKNNNDIDKLLRSHLTPESDSPSAGTEADIDFNLLARYADGTATPEDQERIAELKATNPAFAELVEPPGTLRSDQVRVIPFRRRWLPMALRYAACFVAVLIGSVYLYQQYGPNTPTHKPFITQNPQRTESTRSKGLLEADTYYEKELVVMDDSAPASASRASGVKVATRDLEGLAGDARADKQNMAGTGHKNVKKDVANKLSEKSVIIAETATMPVVASVAAEEPVTAKTSAAGKSYKPAGGTSGTLSKKKAELAALADIRTDSKLQFDNTCALFIGIDSYKKEQAGVAPLKNAVIDMNNVQVAMNDFPFAEVVTLSNEKATRSNIDSSIRKLRRKAGTNGSLLIYYNGQAVQYAEQPEQQFLVPVDGSVNQTAFSDNNISVETLNNDAAAAPIQNTYVVLDCEFQPAAAVTNQIDGVSRKVAMDTSVIATTNAIKEENSTLAAGPVTQPGSTERQARRRAVKEDSKIFISNAAQLLYTYVPQEKEITGEDIANFVASNESVRIQQAPVQQMLRRYRQVEQKGRNYIFYRADHTEPPAKKE